MAVNIYANRQVIIFGKMLIELWQEFNLNDTQAQHISLCSFVISKYIKLFFSYLSYVIYKFILIN